MAMTEQDQKDIEFRARGVRWVGELDVLRWFGPDGMDSTAQALRDRQTLLDEVKRLEAAAARYEAIRPYLSVQRDGDGWNAYLEMSTVYFRTKTDTVDDMADRFVAFKKRERVQC